MTSALLIRVRGVVQGVGFRPYIYRLAHAHGVRGWVFNHAEGVEIHAEAPQSQLGGFVHHLKLDAPASAKISELVVELDECRNCSDFTIRESELRERPSVRISPDLPVCDHCLGELFDPRDPRYRYPYINCTNCGPRYSVIVSLPYDRAHTTMQAWQLDELCTQEYNQPRSRRFHAQPIACPQCGPNYFLRQGRRELWGADALQASAQLLAEGMILAVKGLGGYHLACDARNASAVKALRHRKFRKEKPFAVMAMDLDVARSLVELSREEETLLTSSARPILLAKARVILDFVAPDSDELGVMLPYTPLHHLLFNHGAPGVLVMTSANRSHEPIAYQDRDALDRLAEIADAFLIGQRPIARRVDDSVARCGAFGPMVLRRARGYAPDAVAIIPSERPLLALGADLKNTITLVVNGQALVSQHIGDLNHYQARRAFTDTIRDLLEMYALDVRDTLVVHDLHPQYVSTQHGSSLPAWAIRPIQHHRAHIASVLAEKAELHKRVLGISFDGAGYGDDGCIWGGEFFVGSVAHGLSRVAHLRPAVLPGGDRAAKFPMQAAVGFLAQLEGSRDLAAGLFDARRYRDALSLVEHNVRCFVTTSMGRLFDTVAALLGFTCEVTFEGQAAMWLEHLAVQHPTPAETYPFPFVSDELDFRPLLEAVIGDRLRGRRVHEIARTFHKTIAQAIREAATRLCVSSEVDTIVLSGGVFQNQLLMRDLKMLFRTTGLQLWTNHLVPPNDGGISLGQAAIAAYANEREMNELPRLEQVVTLM